MVESTKTIKLFNLSNKNLNFDNNLSSSNSLLIKNCKDLTIFLKDKINKVTIENSNGIFIIVEKLIVGFEISKSSYVLIKPINNDNFYVPFIGLYKSTLFLVGNINDFLQVIVASEKSDIYNVNTCE